MNWLLTEKDNRLDLRGSKELDSKSDVYISLVKPRPGRLVIKSETELEVLSEDFLMGSYTLKHDERGHRLQISSQLAWLDVELSPVIAGVLRHRLIELGQATEGSAKHGLGT